MNVTSNGYYSQQYLNEQQRKQASSRSPYNQSQYNQSYYDPAQSYYTYSNPNSRSGSPKEFVVEVDEKDPISYMPPMEFTPLQRDLFISNVRPRATNKSKSESNIYPPTGSHRSTSSLPADNPKEQPEPVEYDDVESANQLEETMTPAQLNYLHQAQAQNQYTPYAPEPRGPYVPQEYYPMREAPRQRRKNKNDDYYIRQKKRYDNAQIVKPKMYSHRTFHDVFEDKDEKLDRYNPMDMVFEGKDNQPKPTFLDKVQNKLYKEKYEDYNYYDHRPKKFPPPPPDKDVFVNDEGSDDDYDPNDTEMVEVNEAVTVGEGKNKETKLIKKKVPLKKIMKQKLDIAKKELGRDFADYSKRQQLINQQLKIEKEELRKKKEAQKLAEKERIKAEKKEQKRREKKKAREAAAAEEEGGEGAKEGEDAKSEAGDDLKSEKEDKDGETKDENAAGSEGWWPYLASWWVYPEEEKEGESKDGEGKDNGDEDNKSVKSGAKSEISDVSSVRTVRYQPTPFEKNFKKIKVFSNNSRKFMKHWDEPATKMFHRELLVTPPSLDGTPTTRAPLIAPSAMPAGSTKAVLIAASSKKAPQMAAYSVKPSSRVSHVTDHDDGVPSEIVLECDDSEVGSLITEEMYYNAATKQLEATPPTSASSMASATKFAAGASDARSVVSAATLRRSAATSRSATSSRSASSSTEAPFLFNFDTSAPVHVVSSWINLIKRFQLMKMVYAPIDIIGEYIPGMQGVVVFIELLVFVWLLYELSRLVDAICMMIKAFCAPIIAVGRFMNRIV
ncbi:hypothetical protein Cantr_09620 [Candida viswanathii]|uniref:Uncharacterized protein n=1 Tax=Candida viswanathii TaxID=5486 RepID=A0A367YB46_9ASCO|nr:hypothetical protein Cantr_09620 [Candida viswanathii]